MNRWIRWYRGTTEDGKMRVVARNANVTAKNVTVTVRDVIALWAFMLEDAADDKHRGVCARNEDFMAAVLDFDDGVVEAILGAMQDAEMVSIGHGAITICNWNKRQFEGDVTDPTNAERQRRFRERKAASASNADDTDAKHHRNGDVTVEKRPDTETDKNPPIAPQQPRSVAPRRPPDWPDDYRERFWAAYPNKVGKPKALAKLDGIAKRGATRWAEIMDGLQRYIRDKPPDRPWCNPETWINQERWADAPAVVLPLAFRPGSTSIRHPDGII